MGPIARSNESWVAPAKHDGGGQPPGSLGMIVDTEESSGQSFFDSPTIDSMAGAPSFEPGFALAPGLAHMSHAHPAAQPAVANFRREDMPLCRNGSTPSLLTRRLSEWTETTESDPPVPVVVLPAGPAHRRAKSEGVAMRTVKLRVLVPTGRMEAVAVRVSVPLFYSVDQTIATVVHECRRGVPASTVEQLEGKPLVLRMVEDGEPQFDLPALEGTAAIAGVGEAELALCIADEVAPWGAREEARPSDAHVPDTSRPTAAPDVGEEAAGDGNAEQGMCALM